MNFLEMLERYKPELEQERIDRDAAVHFVYLYKKDAFKRAHHRGHFVTTFLLLNKDKTKLLLARKVGDSDWSMPSFFVESYEDLLEFTRKNTQKLLNAQAITPELPGIFTIDIQPNVAPVDAFHETRRHIVTFLLHTTDEETTCAGTKYYFECRWFPLSEPIPLGHRQIAKLIQKCRDYAGIPAPKGATQKKPKPTITPRKHIPLPKEAFPDNQEPSA